MHTASWAQRVYGCRVQHGEYEMHVCWWKISCSGCTELLREPARGHQGTLTGPPPVRIFGLGTHLVTGSSAKENDLMLHKQNESSKAADASVHQ